eukprot:scaffold43047_cov42-Cyclotella_meneghiniana.AAC.3
MDRSKGFSRGREGTMLWVSHSTCVADLIILATDCATKEVVAIVIDGFGAFADVMLSIVKYFETEFPFESYGENVVFDSLTFLEAGHSHKGHRCAVV